MWIAFLKLLDKIQLLMVAEFRIREASLGAEPVLAEKARGLSGDAAIPGSNPSEGTKGFSYTNPSLGLEEVFSCVVPAPASCCSAGNAGADPVH